MYKKDVFICHASEDKERYVLPLKKLLEANGISCWFDDSDILVGEALDTAIKRGLKNCRYCLVVMSKIFLEKDWANRELSMIHEREKVQKNLVLLPLLEDQKEEEIKKSYPFLNNRRFLKWSEGEKLVSHVKQYLNGDTLPVEAWELSDYVYHLEALYPVLHCIGRPVQPKDAQKLFSAMQRLFNGHNIFLDGIDESLSFSLDLILRAIAHGLPKDDHYAQSKMDASIASIERFMGQYKGAHIGGLLLNEVILSIDDILNGAYDLDDINRSALKIYYLLANYVRKYRNSRGYHQVPIEISNQLYFLFSNTIPKQAPVKLPALHDEWGWENLYVHTENYWKEVEV